MANEGKYFKHGVKSRGVYNQVDPETEVDGIYTREDEGSEVVELIVNGELTAENCGVFGSGSGSANKTAIETALAMANVKAIAFNNPKGGEYNISGTLTIPTGKTLKFSRGNKLTGSGTISIDPFQIEAGNYQIFDDELSIICPNDNYKTASFKPEWLELSPLYNVGEWYYDPLDTTSVHDGAAVIVSGNGKRLKKQFRGIYRPEDWGVLGDGITDDIEAWQKCIDFLSGYDATIECNPTATYIIDEDLFIDLGGITRKLIIKGNGAKFIGKNIFRKRPADQTEAESTNNGCIKIYDCYFESTGTMEGTAVEIGATSYSEVARCTFDNFEISHHFKFALWSRSTSNIIVRCLQGCTFDIGDWTDATNVNSQSNVSISFQDTFNGGNNECIGFKVRGSSECEILNATVQGSACGWHVYFDSELSTVVKDFTLIGLHSEVISTQYGAVYLRASGGSVHIDRLFKQGTAPITVFVDNESGNNPQIKVSRIDNLTDLKMGSNSNQTMWLFDQMPSGWNFDTYFLTTGDYVLQIYVLDITADGSITGRSLKLKSKYQLDLTSDINSVRLLNLAGDIYRRLGVSTDGTIIEEIPGGETADRPSFSEGTQMGRLYYDTDTEGLIVWDGYEWKQFNDGANLYNADGAIANDRIVNGGAYTLNFTNLTQLGITADAVDIIADDRLGLSGPIVFAQVEAEEADQLPHGTTHFVLPVLTSADKNISLDSMDAQQGGRILNIINKNNSEDYFWTLSTNVYDLEDNIITVLPNLSTIDIRFVGELGTGKWVMHSVSTTTPGGGEGSGAGGDGNIYGSTRKFEKIVTATGSTTIIKTFSASTMLQTMILRSDIGITELKIGTTDGGAEIWSGEMEADDGGHTKDVTLNLGEWLPAATNYYITGRVDAELTVFYLYDTYIGS